MSLWGRTLLFAAVGAIAGVILTFGAGGVCVDKVADSFCGRKFLVWNMSTGAAFALSAATGAIVGVLVALMTTFALSRRRAVHAKLRT